MSKPKAFITGVLGFAGSHLAEELLAHGYEVFGNRYKQESSRNIAAVRRQVKLISLDILNGRRCLETLSRIEPDYIFHLAAVASVGKSFSMVQTTFKINLEGTLNILQAAQSVERLRKLVFVGSADCYGRFKPINKILTEEQPLRPVTPYGIAKTAAEQACLYYHRQHGLPVVVCRSFNHAGPRQDVHFVISDFARQIALIEIGQKEPVMKVGDLSARRDFSDVRDIVRGYRLMAEKGADGEVFQLCSGKTVTVGRVLETLLSMTDKKITVTRDQSRLRKADIPVLKGDNGRAVRNLGFKTRFSLKATLADTLQYWRENVSGA